MVAKTKRFAKRPAQAVVEELAEDDEADAEASNMGKQRAGRLSYALAALDRSGRSYPMIAYKKCKSHEQKRLFLEKWEIDKNFAWLTVEEREYQDTRKEKKTVEDWCHLWDVARLNGTSFEPGNAAQREWLLSLVQGCDSKPSTIAGLAAS
eukprot:10220454-Lingulodinium_polyedra.AAC.1